MAEAGAAAGVGWWVSVSSRGKRASVTPGCCNNNPGDGAINVGEGHWREAQAGLCWECGELEGPVSHPTSDVGGLLSKLELGRGGVGDAGGSDLCLCLRPGTGTSFIQQSLMSGQFTQSRDVAEGARGKEPMWPVLVRRPTAQPASWYPGRPALKHFSVSHPCAQPSRGVQTICWICFALGGKLYYVL